MSVQTEIDRIIGLVHESHEKAQSKGGTTTTPLLANLPGVIDSIPQGVELPELGDTAAQPTDMALGKVLYDDEGNPVTGELYEILEGQIIAATEFKKLFESSGGIINTLAAMNVPEAVVRKNSIFRATAPSSAFGNATADQVAKGATFTSAAGLLVEGTMEPGITPSGSLDITENGTFDVTNYASVNVEVPEGPSLPEGAIAVQMVTGDQTSTKIGSGYSLSVTYGDAVEIDDSITLAFVGTSKTLSNISASTDFSALDGKYVRVGSGGYTSTSYKFYYIPSGATFTVGGSSMSKTLTCDKAQEVTLQKVSL